MCAIVDANVVGEVFGNEKKPEEKRPEAGERFFEWLNGDRGVLVVGGKVSKELGRHGQYKEWARQAFLSGQLRRMDENAVRARTEKLKNEGVHKSDDPHILALAQISGARLLYSNDRDLHQDFKNPALIDKPRGKVYSTLESREFQDSHKRLLARTNLCRSI